MAAAPKMEVLTRPAGALQSMLRVMSDSSMTIRLSIPSSFVQAREKNQLIATPQAPNNVENAVESISESWEERDWETAVIQTEKRKVNYQDQGEWEQKTTPALPDDFPRLIVNLTKVQRHYFAVSKEEEEDKMDLMEVFHRIKTILHQHFSQVAEGLFEQRLCFHCTYGTSRTMMDNLHVAYPEDTFAMVDYPTKLANVPLHEYLHILSYPSKWKSVEYLKDCVCRCSRDMKWKKDVITELHLLAEQESTQYEAKLQQLSDEIDELTRLRNSFREQLARSDEKARGKYALLQRLEHLEKRLESLLDEYLKEPELKETECYSAFGTLKATGCVQAGTNVLDMVIAMVFCRLPRDLSQHTTPEEHFQMLFDHHIHILRLWKKDFGRLPRHSRLASAHHDVSGLDVVQNEQSEEQLAFDLADQGGNEKQIEALSSYCRMDRDELLDDCRSIDVEEIVIGCDKSRKDEMVRDNNDLDGYGADYDSEDREDEEQTARQVKNAERLKAVKGSTRVHQSHIKRTSRHSLQPQKTRFERRSRDQGHDDARFQPFACTKAVKLLRLAKENETF